MIKFLGLGIVGAFPVVALSDTTLSTYGTPGLVETPVATGFNVDEFSFGVSISDITLRNTLVFQLFPRAYGSFRYSITDDFLSDGPLFDRSFDAHFVLLEERDALTAIGIGLRDLLGTGILSGEYIVATKQVSDRLSVTGGVGWGRFAGRGKFDNPLTVLGFDNVDRSGENAATGGQFAVGRWFQGPAALFGGLNFDLNEQLSIQLEYSPDLYYREQANAGATIRTPINAALEYRFQNGVGAKVYLIGGTTLGGQFDFAFDLKNPLIVGGREDFPAPIRYRGDLVSDGLSRNQVEITNRLEEEGLALANIELSESGAILFVQNDRWGVEAQAAGRAARILANTLPPQIEEFTIVFQERGVPISSVTTHRADLEDLQYDFDSDWRTLARAVIEDASTVGAGDTNFRYDLGPYAATSFFDPQSPIRIDFGAELRASYQSAPGFTFDARIRYPVAGNLGDSDRESDSVIQKVRSESFKYAREADLEINQLTAEYIWRPAPEAFARITTGYLENQYGGLSSEFLWSPIDSRLALGVELNYVKQRDFDMLLGFQDYDVVTGHASAYYDIGNGFHSQVDVGRYLAGDWGGTLTVKREFNNGVKVGGYFTLTDVPFDDFGEGSFDKGLTLEIPLSFFTGQPSRRVLSQKLQPILRDGGARLNVQNRLYPFVRDYRGPELRDGWGRYLR